MRMIQQQDSKYWLDIAVEQILHRFPKGEIIVSSGISPSASYHIGHFREILIADALVWGIRQRKRKVRHIHVVDNFDPLRKRYDFLPKTYEKYVGWPVCLVPDPYGECHKSYADHFYSEFEKYATQMGIGPDKVVRAYEDLYRSGKMTACIEDVLRKHKLVKDIFERISNRHLPDDWIPVQVMKTGNKFENASIRNWDKIEKTIEGVDYTSGKAKLNWRLDWPARWKVLGVMVEPFSAQEHGAAGGSYDTGVEFSKEIFHYNPPIPGVTYGNVHLVGHTVKMSSSKANFVTPKEALEIMPAEVLRYFVVRSKPEKTLVFDPGVGLFNLLDEFSKIKDKITQNEETEFAESCLFATQINHHNSKTEIVSKVPFSHLVSVYQASRGNIDLAKTILKRSGYQEIVAKHDSAILEREFSFIKKWLKKYAPESVKFEVKKLPPKITLKPQEKTFIRTIYNQLGLVVFTAESIHQEIYNSAIESQVKPARAFKLLYRIFIGKNSGPRLGFFLESLGQRFVLQRLKHYSK